jgi:hypothetical protein
MSATVLAWFNANGDRYAWGTSGHLIAAPQAYRDYCAWMAHHGLEPVSLAEWSQALSGMARIAASGREGLF